MGNRRSRSLRELLAFPSRFPGRPASTTGICFRTRIDLQDRWLNFGRMSLTLDHSGEADGSREGTAVRLSSCVAAGYRWIRPVTFPQYGPHPYIPLLFCPPHTMGCPSSLQRTRWWPILFFDKRSLLVPVVGCRGDYLHGKSLLSLMLLALQAHTDGRTSRTAFVTVLTRPVGY